MNRLKTSYCLTIETTSKYTLISINNFMFFQGIQDENDQKTDQQNDQQNDQQATSERPANDHIVRNRECGECKEKKNDNGARKRFSPPSADEVSTYCRERGNTVDAEQFCNFYASKGWRVGSQPMRDWKAAVRTWEKREGSGHVADRRISLDEL